MFVFPKEMQNRCRFRWKGRREGTGSVRGRETIIRISCLLKKIFSINRKDKKMNCMDYIKGNKA